jgi:hypothetical protein
MWEAIVKISWVYFLSCAVVLYDAFPVPLVTTGSGKRLPDVEGSIRGPL